MFSRSLFRRVFAVLALLVCGVVNASFPPSTVEYSYPSVGVWSTSAAAACQSGVALEQSSAGSQYTVSFVNVTGTAPNFSCVMRYTLKSDGSSSTANRQLNSRSAAASCPANATLANGSCSCNPGYDESGGQCVPHVNQCTSKTGQVGILNWTEGYTRTPDEGDRQAVGPVMTPPSNGQVCDGGCTVSLQLGGPGVQPMVSQSPTANGLYRRSVDYPSMNLGSECTMGTADTGAKKDAPPPDCPGSVGEIGGKTVCVGTAAKPVTTAPLGQPPAPAVAGNPAAGPKPASGEGSGTGSAGRTPSTGNGTATGGPSGAAVGGKGGGAGGTASSTAGGTGTGETPTPCGAPGQAICAVKVDETGTPSNAGTTFDAAKEAVENSGNQTIEKINQARDRTDGPAWSFTFALPTGCSPYPVGFANVVLNVCQYQGTIHDLLSMVWAAVTAFTIIGMVGRTIRGT